MKKIKELNKWRDSPCTRIRRLRTSLAVQWLRLHATTAGGTGSIPGQGTKIPHATWQGQKKKKFKKTQCCQEVSSSQLTL